MDPITTAVVAALANLSQTAVKEAYNALKDVIKRKFGAESGVSRAVSELEAKPQSQARAAVLEEEVANASAATDSEILAAADAILERAGIERSSIQVNASGERSVAIGGNVHGGKINTGDRRIE